MTKITNDCSPMMKRYFSTKEQYKDCILMYRLGDFYEMFFEDAIEASKILDITLTGRNCGMEQRAPMCGVPYHAVDAYVAKLISAGKKVAICEQLEDPSTTKDILDRGVIRVVTAGTAIEQDIIKEDSNNYLMSVFFAQTNDIGIAICDVSTGELIAYQSKADKLNSIEEFMLSYKPSEIICNSEALILNEKLKLICNRILPKMNLYFDWAYSKQKATEIICNQYSVTSINGFGLDKNIFALSACGGLIQYLNDTQKRSLPHLRAIRILSDKRFMSIDVNTRRNLELTNNTHDNGKYGSLLWLLDKTKTSMGARKLLSWINQPLQSVSDINLRLDAVDELFKNFILREPLIEAISNIKDIERLSTKFAYKTANPRDMAALAASISQLPEVIKRLSNCKSQFLRLIFSQIVPFDQLSELLTNAVVEDNCPVLLKDGGFIKQGFNQKLDEYRSILLNTADYINSLREEEAAKTGIKNLKIGNNRVFGYYFEVSNMYKNLIPQNYIRKQSLAGAERFITEELKIAEEKIFSAEENAIKMEQEIFKSLCDTIINNIPDIQRTANAIAALDVLLSFSKISVQNSYVRPQIGNSNGKLQIIEGRHPIVEKFLKGENFVSNNILLDTDKNRTMILTGPNMAGKSTFMRQVALITLMAHIGCFVPAKQAIIPLTDKIFTRVGASDEISFNQSTFMVEMSEVAYILNNATPHSLIVLDEVGRGTATFDGLSIAWAIMEKISNDIKAKTMFATHYHELTELEGRIDGVVNYKIAVKEIAGSIVFLRKIVQGGANKSFGIEVAQLAGVPQDVTSRAHAILKLLEKSDINKNVFAQDSTLVEIEQQQKKEKKALQILEQIKSLNLETCTPLVAFDILCNLVSIVKEND